MDIEKGISKRTGGRLVDRECCELPERRLADRIDWFRSPFASPNRVHQRRSRKNRRHCRTEASESNGRQNVELFSHPFRSVKIADCGDPWLGFYRLRPAVGAWPLDNLKTP